MDTLLITKTLTMSSREIAELTGKQHFHVTRDIRNMLANMYDGIPDDYKPEKLLINPPNPNLVMGVHTVKYDQDITGRPIYEYRLDKRHTLNLLTRYDDKGRMRVIDRWLELEEKLANQATKITEALTWEQQRQVGKEIRAEFTDTLKDHGVKGFGFAQCTNGIYRPLFGATAATLKDQRGLDKKAFLRDAMSSKELIASACAEIVASERIELD